MTRASFVDFPVLVSGDGTFRISKPSVALPSLWRSAESLIVLIPEYSPTHSPIHSGIPGGVRTNEVIAHSAQMGHWDSDLW
ncbi:hypothetical protein TNCV_2544441 [Trichonephila clavipes]|nr:hypothetical protein TNCV_2544441 [Trichonephila clavipes]